MKDLIVLIVPWLTSAVAISMMWMTGNKDRRGWALSLFSQVLWLVFIITSKTWGLLPLNIAMWYLSIRNFIKWSK